MVTGLTLLLSSCKKESDSIKNLTIDQSKESATDQIKANTKKLYVCNVKQLYDAINNPANEGCTLVLAPGTYKLDPDHQMVGALDLASQYVADRTTRGSEVSCH